MYIIIPMCYRTDTIFEKKKKRSFCSSRVLMSINGPLTSTAITHYSKNKSAVKKKPNLYF